MKRIFLFIVIMLAGVLLQMSAQESVTVHVAGQSLESLLTEEQKQSVRSLTVTGTLAEADYAYLRSGLLNQLDTLNLRRAEIDTIPTKAFYCELSDKKPIRRIILPEHLKHLADSSLWVKGDGLELELTGEFPSNGKNVYFTSGRWWVEIKPSVDNKSYKVVDDILYSSDGRVLYHANYPGVVGIADGVHVICSNAFESAFVQVPCVVPSTVDSIGDRAFANLQLAFDFSGTRHDNNAYIVFQSLTPPRLGTDVFLNDLHEEQFLFKSVYVPDESLDLYLKTDGWKDVVSGGISIPLKVEPLLKDVYISVLQDGETFRLVSQKTMTVISFYDAIGRLLLNKTVNSDEATIPKSVFNSSLVIVKVNFADGTTETLKLQL